MIDLKSKLKPRTRFIHSVRDELAVVIGFIAVIWVVYVFDLITTNFFDLRLVRYGLIPRTLRGLLGIFTMTFLHDGFWHLMGNTLPLFILLSLLAGSRAESRTIVVLICLIGGTLLWVVGNPIELVRGWFVEDSTLRPHVGASLLIFGLITFLISSGFLERRPIPLLIAIVVGFFYGTTLLWGIIPKIGGRESWEGHLCGGIAGFAVAYWLIKKPDSFAATTKPFSFRKATGKKTSAQKSTRQESATARKPATRKPGRP